MRTTFLPLLVFVAIFAAVSAGFGHDTSFAIAYGMVAAMAFVISVSFFWLWYHRATPLALGMALCKLGSATMLAWYAVYRVLDRAPIMIDHEVLGLFIGLYFVGAAHHFAVIQKTVRINVFMFIAPVIAAIALLIVSLAS